MTGRRFSIISIVIICIISIICFVLVGALFYRIGSQIVFIQTRNEAMRIAQSAASDLDGDRFAAIDSEESSGFKYVYDKLAEYRDSENLDYIYSMKKLEEKELVFVVDTDEVAPAEVFEPYEWLEDMAPAFDGIVCADEEYTSDEWGTFISGYAPIYDSENAVVGIVGCDININTISERIVRLRMLIIILGIVPTAVMVMILGRKDSGY